MPTSGIALFDYEAQDSDEISFSAGDEIIVTNKSNDDWFEGRRVNETRLGYFPANRVQIVEDIITPASIPNQMEEAISEVGQSEGPPQENPINVVSLLDAPNEQMQEMALNDLAIPPQDFDLVCFSLTIGMYPIDSSRFDYQANIVTR